VKNLINSKLLLAAIFLFSLSVPAFSLENSINEAVTTGNSDFLLNKKINLEFGISGIMLQGNVIYLLNDKFNPFIRLAGGIGTSRRAAYLGEVAFSADAGLKYNFSTKKNNSEKSLNNFYTKVFAGVTKTIASEYSIFPVAGVGVGYSTINNAISFSLGLDAGSTFEYYSGIGLGGIIFIRPEINLGYVF
jgi:hypothetical protein